MGSGHTCIYVSMYVCMVSQISGDLKRRASPKWYHMIAAWIVHCFGMKLSGCGRHLTSAWHVILASIALAFVESLRSKYSTRQFYENFWWQIRICSSAMRRKAVYFCLLYRQIIGIPIWAFSTRIRLSHAMHALTSTFIRLHLCVLKCIFICENEYRNHRPLLTSGAHCKSMARFSFSPCNQVSWLSEAFLSAELKFSTQNYPSTSNWIVL